jgi:hypothetical protein
VKSIATILLSIVLVAFQQTAQEPAGGTLEGSVVDANTGRPIKNVSVLLRARAAQAYRGAKTDDTGRFSFVNVAAGSSVDVFPRGISR